MKVDFSAVITGLDGTEIKHDGDEALTLGRISVEVLLAVLVDDRGQPERLDGAAKVRNATLAQAIFMSSEPLDLKSEDVSMLKDRIGRAYPPLTVMRAWALLEGEK